MYTTLVGGTALAIFGGVSMWMAIHAVSEPQWTKDDADSSRRWAGLMYAGYGTGAALLLTSGALWLFADRTSTAETPRVAASVVPTANGVALSLGGRW